MRTGPSTQRARVTIVAAALILALAGCASRPMPEHGAPATHAQQVTDGRRQVALTPAERDAVLAEMRTMLGSVSLILHGLTAKDRQATEKAARASGIAMAVDPSLGQKLPRPFLELGMATHEKIDQVADLVKTTSPS